MRTASNVTRPAARASTRGPSASTGRAGWWGVVLVAFLMLLGGCAGLALAAATVASADGLGGGLWGSFAAVFTHGTPSGDFVAILGGAACAVAGFVIGGLLGIAILSSGRPGLRCPRCGTRNASGAGACAACELPFG